MRIALLSVLIACGGGGGGSTPIDAGDEPADTAIDAPPSPLGAGDLVWVKAAGGTSRDDTKSIAALPDGTFFVAGEINSAAAVFGAGEPNETTLAAVAGSADILLARYDNAGSLVWARRVGGGSGGGDDEARAVTAFADGSTVIAGLFEIESTFGPGTPNETTFSGAVENEVFVARHDADGNFLWVKRVIGVDDEQATSISGFADGSFVVGGKMFGTGSRTFGPGEANEAVLNPTSAGNQNGFLARYNADGTFVWARSFSSTTGSFTASSVTTLADGSLLFAGSFEAQVTLGVGESNETVLTATGNRDGFVAKYGGDGTLAWARRVVTEVSDLNSIAGMADGAFAIVGSIGRTFGTGTSTFGDSATSATLAFDGLDVFVARFDANGDLTWARRATGGGNDFGNTLTALPDGSSIVIAGDFGVFDVPTITFGEGEPGMTTLSTFGREDIFIARYDAAGQLGWAKRAGSGGRDDEGTAIAILPDGSTILTGLFGGESMPATFGDGEAHETTLTPTDHDIFVARFEP